MSKLANRALRIREERERVAIAGLLTHVLGQLAEAERLLGTSYRFAEDETTSSVPDILENAIDVLQRMLHRHLIGAPLAAINAGSSAAGNATTAERA